MNISDRMRQVKIVPVVVLKKAEDAVPTANALLAGGIDMMEITLRTPAALECIRLVADACPGMIVGAGTVLNAAQCQAALDAGAKFIVSPGFSKAVVDCCQTAGVTVLPGCVTPTEIMAALDCGIKIVKFFPANVYGGLKAMKALAAPFTEVKFVPTGGVNADNVAEYFAQPYIHAVGGSWVCTAKDIEAGNFDKITELCREALQKL